MLGKWILAASMFWLSLGITVEPSYGGGRTVVGGSPYHNGYYQFPPVSAYSAVTVRPPWFYGTPSYYYPQSYLPPVYAGYGYPAWYPGVPYGQQAAYYMSATGYETVYPW